MGCPLKKFVPNSGQKDPKEFTKKNQSIYCFSPRLYRQKAIWICRLYMPKKENFSEACIATESFQRANGESWKFGKERTFMLISADV